MDIYVSPRGRANLVVGVFAVYVLVEILYIVSTLGEISLLQRIRDGGIYTFEELEASDSRQAIIGLVNFLVIVVLAIVFLVWQYRVKKNEPHLGVTGTRFSPGCSVWMWFIPFVNLFGPYMAMKEAWQASSPEETTDSWDTEPVSPLLGWWWALWLVGGIATSIATQLLSNPDDVTTFISLDQLRVGGSVMTVLSAMFAMVLVRGISIRQEIRYQNSHGLLGASTPFSNPWSAA